MRILVTNDDGIDSVGLHVLARRLVGLGEVVVVAPSHEYSGAGAALGALHLIQPEVRRAQLEGVGEAWSVTGPPALCVMFARLGAFGEPFDLVVSGINPGSNVGRAVYHSGTIGACLTARNGNINSIAISQAVHGFGVEGQAWDDMLVGQRWHTAAEVAGVVAESLCGQRFDEPVVVNLNVPNIEVDELHGWRHTSVGREIPRRMSSAVLEPLEGHQGAFRVKMSWGEPVELPDGTDGGTVERQMVSISFLGRINAEQRHDMSMVDESLSRLLGQPR